MYYVLLCIHVYLYRLLSYFLLSFCLMDVGSLARMDNQLIWLQLLVLQLFDSAVY